MKLTKKQLMLLLKILASTDLERYSVEEGYIITRLIELVANELRA